MTAPTITRNEILAKFVRALTDGPINAAQAVAMGATLDDLLWLLRKADLPDLDRRLRLFGADCAARVLHVFEAARPGDDRPRRAIIAARGYARGNVSAGDLDAARDAAWVAARDAAGAAAKAAADAAGDAAWDAAADAAWAAARAAAGGAGDVEREWQLARLVAWLSDDEPDDWPLPAMQTRRERA